MKKLIAFFKEEDGLETVEYAVILGIVVAATVTAVGVLGGWVTGEFQGFNTSVGAQ
jgi:Flp pilus assembly pilin Flp